MSLADLSHSASPFLPLEGLILTLQEKGFRIHPEQVSHVSILLHQLGSHTDVYDLKWTLAPVFVKNPREQARFYQVFDEYFLTREKSTTSISPAEQLSGGNRLEMVLPDQLKNSSWLQVPTSVKVILGVLLLMVLLILMDNSTLNLGVFEILSKLVSLPLAILVIILVIFAWGWWHSLKRFFRQRRQGMPEFERTAPFDFQLRPPLSHVRIMDPPTARRFSRVMGPEAQEWGTFHIDVPGTVFATVQRAGMIEVQYEPDNAHHSYLLLIDKAQANQHLLNWFNYLHHLLQDDYIHIERCFYEYDPRICWGADGRQRRLGDLYGGQRLIIVGDGAGFVDPLEEVPYPWVSALLSAWTDKFILTPKPWSLWGLTETLLQRKFFLQHASLAGLMAGIQWLNQSRNSSTLLTRTTQLIPEVLEMEKVAELREALNPGAYRWLACCAVYPELDWSLTIYLAKELEFPAGSWLNPKNVTILSQLKWFRERGIPAAQRRELIADLPEALVLQVRSLLLKLLSKAVPPPGSYAYEQHQLYTLRNTYHITKEKEERADIIQELNQLINTTETEDEELQYFVQDVFDKEPSFAARGSQQLEELNNGGWGNRQFRRAMKKWITPGPVQEDLSWALYKEDRVFLVRDQIRDQVAAAENILLFIPDMHPNLKRTLLALQPLLDEGSYDLILVFDFNAYGSKIQESARLLSKKLKSLGLTGKNKSISLLGDRIGGLVARWYIEQENGSENISRLVMVGTMNGGLYSGFFRLYRVWPLSMITQLLSPILKSSMQLIGADPKKPDSIIYQLNQAPDPNTTYYLIAGNSKLIKSKRWYEAFFRWSNRLATGSAENDGFVSVQSMQYLLGKRQANIIEVGLHASQYYKQGEGLEAIYKALINKDIS